MAHDHEHGAHNYNRAFAIGVGLNIGFVLLEASFGLWANSLALLADAGHNLSDVLGLLLAWGASYLAGRPPTARRTYGLRRLSILAALLNAILLLVAIGGIAWEAIQRFGQPAEVSGWTVVGAAGAGVVVNTATALMFMPGRKKDLNVRGAFLHMAADAGVSAAVVVAGLAIQFIGWDWVDPTASLLVVTVIAIGTWGLLRESVDLSLDAVPVGIDMLAVEAYLAGLPGIAAVHDLHVWGLSTTHAALTAHLVKPDGRLDDGLLERVAAELRERFGIAHATIQLEQGAKHVCDLVPHAPGTGEPTE
ncbi:MAG TPA: cation diffusion facilitator family transporter [Gemmataceae bacterium]|nr:cation diffusion facilitator family transporter [Gemmataceae bacterium]